MESIAENIKWRKTMKNEEEQWGIIQNQEYIWQTKKPDDEWWTQVEDKKFQK